MQEKKNVNVDSKRTSSNSNGKLNSSSVRNVSIENEDGSSSKIISSNMVKGDLGKFKSASITFDKNGNISGNFVKGEEGKQISGPRAQRKFNRWSNRLNK